MAELPFSLHATRHRSRADRPRPAIDAQERATDATAESELEADVTPEMRLDFAVGRLRALYPEASAASRLVRWQGGVIAAAVTLVGSGLWLAPRETIASIFFLAAVPALAYLALRGAAISEVRRGWRPNIPAPRPLPGDLPHYSVLVPLYREAGMVLPLLAALERLIYPRDRLEVLLIVEADDAATIAAIGRAGVPPRFRVIAVPCGHPRTKPRALNFALTHARGELVTVFDAEDQPEPDQLLKAAAAFRAGGDDLGCLQARLNVYNPDASWLTRQFTLEYTALFDGILPALERHRLPVMLGGTSNHFPRAVLEAVLAWDPYNVTEDADLGMRLARRGYHVGMLDSTTWEEAPPAYAVWRGQRTRWLKGWLQTYLVHMRSPRRLWRDLGARRFAAFNLMTGGAVLSALVHPWIYLAVAWDIAAGQWTATSGDTIGTLIWLAAGLNLAASYSAAIVLAAIAARARGHRGLVRSSVWIPVYWLAISRAAYSAVGELVVAPHHWEKTAHTGKYGPQPPRADD